MTGPHGSLINAYLLPSSGDDGELHRTQNISREDAVHPLHRKTVSLTVREKNTNRKTPIII